MKRNNHHSNGSTPTAAAQNSNALEISQKTKKAHRQRHNGTKPHAPVELNLALAEAEKANEFHYHAKCAAGEMVHYARLAGDQLIAAKRIVKQAKGSWATWLHGHFDATQQTACLYMRVARNWSIVEPELKRRIETKRDEESCSLRAIIAFPKEKVPDGEMSPGDCARKEFMMALEHELAEWTDEDVLFLYKDRLNPEDDGADNLFVGFVEWLYSMIAGVAAVCRDAEAIWKQGRDELNKQFGIDDQVMVDSNQSKKDPGPTKYKRGLRELADELMAKIAEDFEDARDAGIELLDCQKEAVLVTVVDDYLTDSFEVKLKDSKYFRRFVKALFPGREEEVMQKCMSRKGAKGKTLRAVAKSKNARRDLIKRFGGKDLIPSSIMRPRKARSSPEVDAIGAERSYTKTSPYNVKRRKARLAGDGTAPDRSYRRRHIIQQSVSSAKDGTTETNCRTKKAATKPKARRATAKP